jgi:hypothetical protein
MRRKNEIIRENSENNPGWPGVYYGLLQVHTSAL